MLIVNGKLHPSFILLANKYTGGVAATISPRELNSKLQAEWFQAGKFRAEIVGRQPDPGDLALLNELGRLKGVPPPSGKYDGALLLGSTVTSVRKRLRVLLDNLERVDLEQVFLLGSTRALFPDKESLAVLRDTSDLGPFAKPGWQLVIEPKTEIAMMAMVATQVIASHPLFFMPIVGADQPNGRPANTEGTIEAFVANQHMEFEPTHGGTYLVLSSQPYAEQQLLAVQKTARKLDPEMKFVSCSNDALPNLPMATHLDTLAKELYEEVLLLKE